MTSLKTNLPASAQNNLINKEVVATLESHGLFIQIEVQSVRPDTNWSFYGQASYVQYATDQVIDTASLDTVKKLSDAFGLSNKDAVIMPIYNNNDTFYHLGDCDSELIGFAVMGVPHGLILDCADSERERKLSEQEICLDIEDLTLLKKKEIFQAYLTDANGDLISHIQDIKNHHRDLEVAINHRLKCIEIGNKLAVTALASLKAS